MQSKLDEAKAELLTRAARVAEHAPPGTLQTANRRDRDGLTHLQRYYLRTEPEDLVDRDPVDVLGAALSHYRLAENRPEGTANVRVHTPTVEENGWTTSHSVVEVVTDDMPFLVDSVTNELFRQGYGIHLVIHPQVVVRRDIAGKLIEILGLDGDAHGTRSERPYDALAESWIHVEIDRETDRGNLKQITGDLLRVLSDVRESVEDWEKMRDVALRIAEALAEEPVPEDVAGSEVENARELLRWLADDHYTFLGYREYDLVDGDALAAVPGTGLGILRSDPHRSADEGHPVSPSFQRLPTSGRARAREHDLLILTKANSRSTVHRPSYLDYVGVKKFDAEGNVVGERRFLGLFSSAAYTESVRRVPVVRTKVAEVLERTGFTPSSHDGRDLLQILETYPRDELFQTPVDQLQAIVTSVLYLQERRRLRLYLRQDEYGRYYSALVYLPRDRYTTAVRLRLMDILKAELGGISIDFSAWNTESILSRIHFVVRVHPGTELLALTDADVERIEGRLVEAARSWADGFQEALIAECGEERAAELLRRYGTSFAEGYKADHSPRAAVADLIHLERLAASDRKFALSLYEPVGAGPGERRFKIYCTGEQISLSAVLPVLQRLGVEVTDERPYELRRSDRVSAWIYDFGLRMPVTGNGETYLGDDARERFEDAFAAVWTGKAENDDFNTLVLSGGLTWRQAAVLRAYTKYLRQAGATFSQDYIEDTLRNNVQATRLLISLFEARMAPSRQAAGSELVDAIVEELNWARKRVASADEGRILQTFHTLIGATLRTNFFQRDDAGEHHSYVSMKFDPQAVPELPAPRPAYEIWVYSPRVEGVHLRFGKVSRGTVQWSQRREDFRRELMGMVDARMLRNSGVVSEAALGGFVAKQLPDPAIASADWLNEGLSCYETFLSGVLDITDNLLSGEVVPPKEVVRHDSDDPYLWLSPDPDMPNYPEACRRTERLLTSYGFWLSDAFGGARSPGISATARGIWEAMKQRLDESCCRAQPRDFTAVAVGSVSGDLLSEVLQLSEGIRLVAAFDDRHVLLDPDPDPVASRVERLRLLREGSRSWGDYAPATISEGGGVHRLQVRKIVVSPQVRRALGLPASVSELSPAEMIQAVIAAPVDILALGGTAMAIKTVGEEPPIPIGERSPTWADSTTLRARCLVELRRGGATQAAREHFALRGGLAAVDVADLAATRFVEDRRVDFSTLGSESGPQRPGWPAGGTIATHLLERIGDDAAARCRDLHELIALDARTSHSGLTEHLRAIPNASRSLAAAGSGRDTQDRRAAAGAGLARPELAVLLFEAHSALRDEVLKPGVLPDDWAEDLVHRYFSALPPDVRRHTERHHPLRARIAASEASWELLKALGPSRPFSFARSGGGGFASLTRNFAACRSAWQDCTEAAEHAPMQYAAAMGVGLARRKALSGSLLWLLTGTASATPPPGVPLLSAETLLSHLVPPRLDDLVQMGVPRHLAVRTCMLSLLGPQFDAYAAAVESGEDVAETMSRYVVLATKHDVATAVSTTLAAVRAGGNEAAHQVSLLGQARACLKALALATGRRPPHTEEIQVIDALIRQPVPKAGGSVVRSLRSMHQDLRRTMNRTFTDPALVGWTIPELPRRG
ncbi:NAD-glutamate dehydrogenase domain-containing protein [Streptomyces spororaveus]|uniref:NAD-glutamate dehydrogenase domain-containing protein n=1 Tax=Streptomyces spororaveus TaxID=284039 RepID=UPI00378D462C